MKESSFIEGEATRCSLIPTEPAVLTVPSDSSRRISMAGECPQSPNYYILSPPLPSLPFHVPLISFLPPSLLPSFLFDPVLLGLFIGAWVRVCVQEYGHLTDEGIHWRYSMKVFTIEDTVAPFLSTITAYKSSGRVKAPWGPSQHMIGHWQVQFSAVNHCTVSSRVQQFCHAWKSTWTLISTLPLALEFFCSFSLDVS